MAEELPNVIVDFVLENDLMYIQIKNYSSHAPAVNVRTKFDQPILGFDGKKVISEIAVFRHLDYLAPLKVFKVFTAPLQAFLKRLKRDEIAIKVSYEDDRGKRFAKAIRHNLSIYKDLPIIKKRWDHE